MKYSKYTTLNGRAKFILLFLLFFGSFLIATSYTDADLTAERKIIQNRFVAIVLNFLSQNTANNTPLSTLLRTTSLQPGGFDVGSLRIRSGGQSGLKYAIRTVKINGDDAFCGALKLRVFHRDLASQYDGGLMNLNITATIQEDSPKDIIVLVSLDDTNSALQNKLCEFHIVVRTYRNNPDEMGGIYAERKILIIVSSGSW